MGKIGDDGLVKKQVKEPVAAFSNKRNVVVSDTKFNIHDDKTKIVRFSDGTKSELAEHTPDIVETTSINENPPEPKTRKKNSAGKNDQILQKNGDQKITTEEKKLQSPQPQKKNTKKTRKESFNENHYSTKWISMTSIMMFLITFYTSFFVLQTEVPVAFVKACFTLAVVYIFCNLLVFLWNFTIPRDQWMLIVHGPPAVESRSEMRNRRDT